MSPLALALTLTASAQTANQTPQFTDPANLRGERVRPRDGRELPIDGGPAVDGKPNTALALQQLLRRLNTRASILNIVAHPDDEDGGMLTYYSRGLGARVADLSLTRGEGGQNAMTGDFEDALGLLRTQELLANDRYVGVDQMFGTEVDFGFSKTKSEAFAKWTHDRVLYDAVRAVRLYRPLVITSTWIGSVTDGHGQHQVAGQIAQEAFLKAGDPTVFPDQIAEGILPWQPLRVYARVPTQSISEKGLFDYATGQYVAPTFTNYVTGEVTTTPPTPDITVHEGQADLLLTTAAANPADLKELGAGSSQLAADGTNLTYIQFARIGLGLQRSQIPAGFRPPPTGTYDVPYHLYGTCPTPSFKACHPERSEGPASPPKAAQKPTTDPNFFTGIDTSNESMAALAPHLPMSMKAGLNDLATAIQRTSSVFLTTHSPLSQLNGSAQQLLASSLADALHRADSLIVGIESASLPTEEEFNILHELRIKQVQLNDALALFLGFFMDTVAMDDSDDGDIVALTHPIRTHVEASTPAVTGPTLEWIQCGADILKTSQGESSWTFADPLPFDEELQTMPYGPSKGDHPYFSRANIEQPTYRLLDETLRNSPLGPPPLSAWATAEFLGARITVGRTVHDYDQPLRFVPSANIAFSSHAQVAPRTSGKYEVTLKANGNPESLKNVVIAADVRPYSQTGDITKEPVLVHGTFPTSVPQPPFDVVAMHNQTDPPQLFEGYRPIGYGDLPHTNYFTPAKTRIIPVDLKLPTKRRIAYLPGTGDAVPEALASIGLPVTTLTVADLTLTKLAHFDTVVLGVRTYAAHPDLHGAPTQALLDYAKAGGNVLIQYQTAEFTAADAPYPLTLGGDAEKVVDETAPVKLLLPAQPGTAPGGIVKDTLSPTPTIEYALLNTPNVITSADFNGWVEERGHGFLRTWDPHYAALTETHDPGSIFEGVLPQSPQRGGLITTPLGKGRWTYCAFAIYRQLPEAVPGAYRLFLNLINP